MTLPDHLLQALQERLREYGVDLEIAAPGTLPADGLPTDAGVDAIVTLSRGGATTRYAVVVKEPMTLSALAHGPFPTLPYPLLLVGDRITRRSAAAFRDAGVQFMDALGNAYLAFDNVLVEVRGRTETIVPASESSPRAARPQHPTNIFSSRRSQIVLALLAWPELAAGTIREVARTAGVSVGQAHDALTQLEQAGFLVPASRRLDRADELLDFWTAAYPAGLGRGLEMAKFHGDPSRPISRPNPEQPIYLSSESAEGTDIARPATLTVYLDGLDPKLPIMNRWTSSPDRAPNVFVRRKFWVSPHSYEEQASAKGQNAPWPLVYADLMAVGDARLAAVARTWRTSCARSAEV